jgi:hypothetical protein
VTDPVGRLGTGGLHAVLAAWLVSLGFDLFLHGGLLARLYARPSEFLLPAEAAFRRIPLGYLSFLVLTGALYWLFGRLRIRGAVAGLRVGLATGLILWGSWVLGLYSISLAEADLLVGWWLGQSAELGLAGAVLGAAAAGITRGQLYAKAGVAIGLCVIATLALQALGWAPPMSLVGSP